MRRRTFLILGLAALVAGTALWTGRAFRADLAAARAALAAHESRSAETRAGPVAYAVAGAGFPLLSIHGTGGGYDQGLALAASLVGEGYRVIAPSRFGYPGSPVPAGRSDAAAQADALADLLDVLGVRQGVMMGASAGAITALAFAARHPDRTAALVLLVPAWYPPERAAPAPWSPLATRAIAAALRSDLLFWAALRLAPDRMVATILATPPEVLASAGPAERARLDAMLRAILPISARAEGLLLDAAHTAAPAGIDLAAIAAPVFIAAAEDDAYRTADSARLLAARLPGAELLVTPDGGHVWVNRAAEVQAATAGFLARVLPAR